MRHEYNLREQLEAFEVGTFLDDDSFYFYDWFCRDASLNRKAQSLMTKVKKFVKVAQVDLDKTYVFFKNNCPMVGSLYDDFRICDKESGDVIYTVTPSCGHKRSKGVAHVWGKANEFKEPLFDAESWSQLIKTLVVV
jgi:hypothetical protein